MFGVTNTSTPEFQTSDAEGRRSLLWRCIAILCALGITFALMMGYSYLRWRHAERLRAQQAADNPIPKPSPSPQAQVFVDEAMIKGSEAVIGGTIQNTSPNKLTNLIVELELKHRMDGKSEIRSLAVVPSDLDPNQQGRYSLNVPSREFRESRIQSIKTGQSSTDLPFKIMPGAMRPDERLPTKETIVVKPPPKRGNGEEFINTPDNPVKVH